MWIGTAITTIGGAIGAYVGYRREVTAANREANLARIKSSDNSWKDEAIVIIWAYPFVTAFCPWFGFRENTVEAFKFIITLPEWYVWGWVSISLAVFGVSKLLKFKVRK